MKTSSKILLFLAAILLVASIFLPIWRIELDAPQYPEGLAMQIYSNKLGGDVEIINGLNHYIGMATLHAENFIEFTVLPYIIGFFAAWTLLAALLNRPRVLYSLLLAFIMFGIVAMIDFWRWEYNYGHNLDPHAAIVVPGMAYQPPLIGFKQLLNFGAYSIPDVGGWLFIVSGLLMVVATGVEAQWLEKWKNRKGMELGIVSSLLFLLFGCQASGPEPIALNKDECDFCKMTIVDGRFGSELVTKKGRAYKFDDVSCLLGYVKETSNKEIGSYHVHDYLGNNSLIDAETAFYVESDSLRSPMGGNIAALKTEGKAKELAKTLGTSVKDWNAISAR